jgi:TonB family protein
MNRQHLADELDQQVERLRAQPDFTLDKGRNSLLSIAEDLGYLPTPAFRSHLLTDLMAKAESTMPLLCPDASDCAPIFQGLDRGADHCLDQLVGGTALGETLPILSGKSFRLFPVDHRSFVLSFLSHTVLILLIASGIVIGTRPIRKGIYPVSPITYLSLAHGGGGSGRHNPLPVSQGTPPPFSNQQLSSPILVETHPSRLPVAPTVVGPPEIKLPESNQLGDLMASPAALPSNGSGSGGAMGDGTGTGLGSGILGGVGPGRDGGFGDGPFSGGRVIAPREIYNPDPEYSEEGRKAKQQGIVVLSLIVDANGRPRDIYVMRSLGMGLDEKAVEALRKWRFEPGKRGGIPVAMRVNVEVYFRLY